MIRTNYEDSGAITDNVLRGGQVEVWGGPWQINRNDYQGAFPGTAVSSFLTVHDGQDMLIAGNHAHQISPSGTTYGFVVFSDRGSDLTVRDNVIDGGIGRDAAVVPAGLYNFPEIILTESYYPHYEGRAVVGPASRRLLQVPSLRGDPGVAGDLVAILSGPFAGHWFRIAQAIDANNYVLDGDLPAGDYAVSITRGYINEVYEDNTVDTSSLQESSSVAFQLVGPHAGTVVRDNLVIGAKPFDISASPTQESLPGSTPTPAPWGWSHLPVLDLLVEGNTFRDPVFWIPSGDGTSASPTIAAGTLTVEHGTPIRENGGRLYLSGALTNNRFVYSDAILGGHERRRHGGSSRQPRLGRPGGAEPDEHRGQPCPDPGLIQRVGSVGHDPLQRGHVSGQPAEASYILPAPPTVIPGVTSRSLGQDGSDLVGRSATTGPDGLQDVHIVLAGLPTNLAIRTVDVNPYGYGHYQYAVPDLPAGTPGLEPGAWRAALLRVSTGLHSFAATADLYVQPDRPEDGRNHWDIRVTYVDGSTSFTSTWGIVVSDPSLPVGTPVAGLTAVALGQDNADLVGKSSSAGPDGFQDVHIALSGLPAGKAVAQVDVFPYGYGHYQYVAPDAPPLPSPHHGVPDRNPGEWRAALIRPDNGSTTAELYVPSLFAEDGVQPGVTPAISNHYDVMILFDDGSSAFTIAWGVVDDPALRVVSPNVTAVGQDGHDLAQLAASAGPDGVSDVPVVMPSTVSTTNPNPVTVAMTSAGLAAGTSSIPSKPGHARRVAGYQSPPITSPPSRVRSPLRTWGKIVDLTNRVEPSPSRAWNPPGCPLPNDGSGPSRWNEGSPGWVQGIARSVSTTMMVFDVPSRTSRISTPRAHSNSVPTETGSGFGPTTT